MNDVQPITVESIKGVRRADSLTSIWHGPPWVVSHNTIDTSIVQGDQGAEGAERALRKEMLGAIGADQGGRPPSGRVNPRPLCGACRPPCRPGVGWEGGAPGAIWS